MKLYDSICGLISSWGAVSPIEQEARDTQRAADVGVRIAKMSADECLFASKFAAYAAEKDPQRKSELFSKQFTRQLTKGTVEILYLSFTFLTSYIL